METAWFILVAIGLTMYVVLDGFDIGAGALHLLAARTEDDRAQVLRSIRPFFDANEVWLIAGGGTLYFAFPALYSSAFSGFYLPLMIVLWLMILRGIAIEFRDHMHSAIWIPFWDTTFWLASTLLALFFGAALGNVVRGVPLDENGEFFLPLWTNFRVQHDAGILDWYTLLVAVLAWAALAHHGALWLSYKTHEDVERRAIALAKLLWFAVAVLTIAVTVSSFSIQPHLWRRLVDNPWTWGFPILALTGLAYSRLGGDPVRSFLGSCGYIAGMMLSLVATIYPLVLPSLPAPGRPDYSLTIHNSAAGRYGLAVGIIWWIPAALLAGGYAVFLYWRFSGKIDQDSAHPHM